MDNRKLCYKFDCMKVLPNSCWQVIVGTANKLKVYDVRTSELLNTLGGHEGKILAVSTLCNGHVISGSCDNTLKIWDINIKDGQCLETLRGHTDSISCLSVLPNGHVISGSCDNTLKIWDIEVYKCIATIQVGKHQPRCMATMPDGRTVVSGGGDETLKIWNIEDGKCIQTLEGHSAVVSSVVVLPDGKVVSGSFDCTLKVWDITTGKCLNTLSGHKGTVYCLSVLPNGQVVSGSGENEIKTWDIATGECLSTIDTDESVAVLGYLPNGSMVTGYKVLQLYIDDEVQSECQIRKSARILAQGYRDKNSLFSILKFPKEVLLKISGLAGDPEFHNEIASAKIANRYFERPLKK